MLKNYETPISASMFAQVYDTLEKSTLVDQVVDDSKLNESLLQVKGFLDQAKKATGIQFMCFQEAAQKRMDNF